jgi:hypothetical protein
LTKDEPAGTAEERGNGKGKGREGRLGTTTDEGVVRRGTGMGILIYVKSCVN